MTPPINSTDDAATLRQAMVSSQLRTTGVTDTRIIAAMAQLPRERFLPDTAAGLAYRDSPVPLGEGRAANIPLATARLLNQALLRSGDRVLLIGAAGGYTAAVLARIVASVVAVESSPALAAHARAALADLPDVSVVEGPLEAGHAAGAPYDVLVIDGAIEALPDALAQQVAEDGRIVTGLIERGVSRLASGTRAGHAVALTPFVDIDAVPLPGFAKPKAFVF